MQEVKACFQMNSTNQLINYLKTANSSSFANCDVHFWIPVIEHLDAPSAFLTDEPENILKSRYAPVMDVMFSFASQVI